MSTEAEAENLAIQLSELTAVDCPLLQGHEEFDALLGKYNVLAEVLRQIDSKPGFLNKFRKKSADFVDPEGLTSSARSQAQEQAEIGWLYSDLTRRLKNRRFRVGFVGRSQVGKSSAVNAVVQSKVLPYGAGGTPCTSSITRLQFFPKTDEKNKPTITPVFMNEEQCDDRIRFFAGPNNLNLVDGDEDLEHDQLLSQVRDGLENKYTKDDEIRLAELLEVLLLSRKAFADKLTGATADPVQFESNQDLENSLPTYVEARPQEASHQALYCEVIVRIQAENISSTLELIDLPGLGSDNIEDDALTTKYVRTLDGLVLFTKADLITGGPIKPLIKELADRVGNVRDRAWLIVSCMDEIPNAADSYYGKEPRKWTFSTVESLVVKHHMELDFVRFLAVKTQVQVEGEPQYVMLSDLGEQERYSALKLKVNKDSGKPEMPLFFSANDHHHFETAFRALMKDGGVGELQRICRTVIAEQVCNAEVKKSQEQINRIAATSSELIEYFANNRKLSDETSSAIVVWARVLQNLPLNSIVPENSFYEQPLNELFIDMWEMLESLDVGVESRGSLMDEHKVVSHALVRVGKKHLFGEPVDCTSCISKVYEKVSEKLTEAAGTNKALKDDVEGTKVDGFIHPYLDVKERGEMLKKRLRSNEMHPIIKDLNSISDDSFLLGDLIDSTKYKKIMERKIESALYGILQRIHNAVEEDCLTLANSWRMKGSHDVSAEFDDPTFFNDLKLRLKPLED